MKNKIENISNVHHSKTQVLLKILMLLYYKFCNWAGTCMLYKFTK